MKLKYWVAKCLTDSDAYSIRAVTRREVREQLDKHIREGGSVGDYGPIHKVTVTYSSAFALVAAALGETRIYEGDGSEPVEFFAG